MKPSEAAGLVLGAVGTIATVAFTYYYIKGGQGGGGIYDVQVGVADSSTGGPVVGAVVSLGSATQVTDNTGECTFAGVTGGAYTLSVAALGYNSRAENVTVNSTAYSFQVPISPYGTCTPKDCPCGQTNDLNCNCVPQQLATMSSPPSVNFVQDWYAHWNEGLLSGSYLCAGATLGGDPGCNGTCGVQSVGAQVVVQVSDVNGKPVCGVPVSGYLSETSIPWRTSDGRSWGHFSLSIPQQTVTTDSAGKATFYVDYQIVAEGSSGAAGGCLAGCCGPSIATAQNYLVSFSATAGSLRTITSVAMDSAVYVYYYASL